MIALKGKAPSALLDDLTEVEPRPASLWDNALTLGSLFPPEHWMCVLSCLHFPCM